MRPLPSIIKGTNKEVFKKILLYYKPPPARVLDCTCGYQHFWDDLWSIVNTKTLWGEEGYEVIFSDIRPLGHIVADYNYLPFRPSLFDVIVYDPPWTDMHKGVNGYKNWLKGDRFGDLSKPISEDDIRLFAKQAYILLKSNGIVVFKIQDTGDWWSFKAYELVKPLNLLAYHIMLFDATWRSYKEYETIAKPAQTHSFFLILGKVNTLGELQ